MRPLAAQYQMASDTAKNALARLAGIEPPTMPDTEGTLEELQERCDRTITFLESMDPAVINASEEREVVLKFPGGTGYRWTGADYLRTVCPSELLFSRDDRLCDPASPGCTLGEAGLSAAPRSAQRAVTPVVRATG